MKKNQSRTSKQPKNKLEIKIKSKNSGSHFVLTPRALSPREQWEYVQKGDRFAEDVRSDRLRHEDMGHNRFTKEVKGGEPRRATTDSIKFNLKRRFDEDETGTHTPLVKRVSLTEGFHKKKSCNSLISGDKVKLKKKTSDKSTKSTGEWNSVMFQRVIGVIIKDYKEGRLK